MKKLILITLILILIPSTLAISTADLISYWDMDNQTLDQHGSNDATRDGVVYDASGKINGNYDYPNGVTPHLDVAHDSSLNFGVGGDFSISMWVETDADANRMLIAKGRQESGYPVGENNWRMTYIAASNSIRFTMAEAGENSAISIDSTSNVLGQQYYHVVVTIEQGTIMRIYINGSEEDTASLSGYSSSDGTRQMFIGANYHLSLGERLHHDGRIDEVAIFGAVLSPSEVTELYNSGNGLPLSSFTGGNTPPVVTLIDPPDNDHLTGGVDILVYNVTDADADSVNCSLYINSTLNATDTTITLDITQGFVVDFNDGIYNWKIGCTDGTDATNSSEWTVIYDSIAPIYTEGFLATDNTTIFNAHDGLIKNFTGYWSDTYMFAWNSTIYYPNGSLANTTDATGLIGVKEWVNNTINMTGWPNGDYDVLHYGSDDHTAKTIPDYDIIIDECDITYITPTANVTIISRRCDGGTVVTEKIGDRYTFRFNSTEESSTWTFNLTSTERLYYRGSLYEYPSFVTGSQWIDFNTGHPTTIYEVKREDDYLYELEIELEDESNEIIFNSIGGLNTARYPYSFEIYAPERINIINAALFLTKIS